MEKIVGLDRRRSLPKFAPRTLTKEFENYRKNNTGAIKSENKHKVILFADVYTNYNNPQIGMAAVKVFDKLGIQISVSQVFSEGRASQSQGLIELAAKEAKNLASYLEPMIDSGYEIIVAEPSVLSLFRYDYKKLINDNGLFNKLVGHTFDPIEYLNKLFSNEKYDIIDYIDNSKIHKSHIFYHPHCQMKTIGAEKATIDFFTKIGYAVEVSDVECCGMAGSFGYKKDFYDISKNIGEVLVKQIKGSDSFNENKIILASGTSCREQIGDEIDNIIYHPIEYLEKILL